MPSARTTPRRTAARRDRVRLPLGLLAAMAIVAGAVLPATAAQAEGGTGAVTVMLVNPQHRTLHVPGVVVTLLGQDAVTTRSSDASTTGRVTFSGMPAETYSVSVAPPAAGAASRLAIRRDDVVVTAGGHVWVEVVLRIGASVGGTITTPDGHPAPGVDVSALAFTAGAQNGHATTDANGHYWIRALGTGTYALLFNDRTAPLTPATRLYGWSYWNDSAATGLSATTFTVRNADAEHVQTVADGYDGALGVGNAMHVQVAAEAGLDLTGAVLDIQGPPGQWRAPFTTSSASSASTSELVRAGNYVVGVVATTTSTGDAREFWWTSNSTPPTADPDEAGVVRYGGVGDVTITLPSGWN